MSDSLRILLSASLNHGKSIGDINEAIRKIEKSASLRKIRLNIDVDQKILKTLTDFNNNLNKINQTMGQQSSVNDKATQTVKNTTNAISSETQAIQKQTKALKDNIEATKKVIAGGETLSRTVTTGSIENSNKQRTTYVGETDSIKQIIETTNPLKDLREAEKVANQIADGRIKAQEKFNNLQEKSQQKRIDSAHKEALDVNNLADQMANGRIASEERVRNFNSEWNKKQQQAIQKNNDVRIADEQKFARMQQDTLSKIETARLQFGHSKGIRSKLDSLVIDAKGIKSTDDFNNGLKNVNASLARTTMGLKAARVHSISFTDSFSQAMIKFPIKYLGGIKTSLIDWNALRVSTLQHKDEIYLFANA